MNAKTIKIKTTEKTPSQRLDVFLLEKLKISRSQAQKMISAGQITVNGLPPKKAGDRIKATDKIEIEKIKRITTGKEQGGVNEIKKTKIKKEKTAPLKIIKTTSDYIVIEKPTGLLTHPTQAEEKESVATNLAKKYPEIKKIGDDPIRPGIVHRLDKDASGLLVVARTQKMFNHLKNQFKNHTIDKEYSVLVHGKVAREWSTINFRLARGQNQDRVVAVPLTKYGVNTEKGKEALTEFNIAKHFVNFTLLNINIHTGRMHQIRAHMLAYNHPVVGDPLYFQKKRKSKWDEVCGRLFLHCTKLAFVDLDGKTQKFESPLPKELSEFLKLLK
ncbi:MAG: Pseudouridine synthase [Candidatus Magasanikbacteria bacterium GW2011_GWC2_34_16]|uniref:Pseudouridine synthase n=2 Tax=Candidatus Magasanikiibacteriota TaxID=1752731 RepID=A0A0G0JUV2_9BACT|nr:MAG: Pseudouridine synthase [Candidatus Magasanikbacteria bacterium GW2011_GWC2_34_16]KKQ40704.1 MAG: Pseudouridine synthase [Candidatus Magasanikbacteria bacterium GW2011_GWA2_37_8]